ncbi:MAG TPA: CGNR zinc finger domain-containing protein [Candidatus Acidoferrum sp.]|nr:CGNR zinc finger domain-containing protein [Candidatus Acidoferrum sp.]
MIALIGYVHTFRAVLLEGAQILAMADFWPTMKLLGGRLSIDFVNATPFNASLTWERLIHFLQAVRIVTPDRAIQLLALTQTEAQAADALLAKAQTLGSSMRKAFTALLRRQRIAMEWVAPINEILRITEGHDELIWAAGSWKIEFIAREGGLDWLLAAVARSAAEIIAEGSQARLRICANPQCGLFFYDTSRTHLRRWCSMATCGNRSKVAAFARRHATGRHSAG